MNREIKFRAWHTKNKRYENIRKIVFSDGGVNRIFLDKEDIDKVDYGTDFYYEADFSAIILEQYTGLKDKNGKEICVGDVVKVGEYCINEIPFYGRKLNYYKKDDLLVITSLFPIMDVRDITDYKKHIENSASFSYNGCMERPRANPYEVWNFQKSLEIIGNIHENKEMVK